MKILIIRFSSIGDIVLTTPLLRCIKAQRPDIEIHYATKKAFYGVLEHNPHISKIHLLDHSLGDLIKTLRKERFDFVADLHHNLRSLIIKAALGVKSKAFAKLNVQKWLLVNAHINLMPAVHIVDRYFDTLKPLGIQNDGLGLEYYPCECDALSENTLPALHKKGYVAFAIGGMHATKRLPVHKIIEAVKAIPHPVLLLGGKADAGAAAQVVAAIGEKVFSACGLFNLGESAHAIKDALYVVTHDTGMMHIAAAFGKKIYAIWGSTVPAFGMYPYKTHHVNIENTALACRPCSKIGFNTCPKGHFKCMEDLHFEFE
jgi:heptosyltransferase-2